MEGKIVRWKDDRGFGFISSPEINGDIFVHISQFPKGYRSPKPGDSVKFQLHTEKGKQSARSASLIGVPAFPKKKKSYASAVLSLLLTLGFAVGGYALLIEPMLHPAYENMGFKCEGKTHCSQMTSCDEARFYLANCPNVQIDGNHDGDPCESQWCNSGW